MSAAPPEGWRTVDGALQREFTFTNFAQAMAFANRIAEIAEAQNHHPDLHVSWGLLVVRTSSHDVGAITDRDARLAEAIDAL